MSAEGAAGAKMKALWDIVGIVVALIVAGIYQGGVGANLTTPSGTILFALGFLLIAMVIGGWAAIGSRLFFSTQAEGESMSGIGLFVGVVCLLGFVITFGYWLLMLLGVVKP